MGADCFATIRSLTTTTQRRVALGEPLGGLSLAALRGHAEPAAACFPAPSSTLFDSNPVWRLA